MKKCPKCKAEIDDEARFCLYCMTSFEEKETIETPKDKSRRCLYIAAAVLVVALIVSGIFILTKKDIPSNNLSDTSSKETITSNDSANIVINGDSDSNERDSSSSVSGQPSATGEEKSNSSPQNQNGSSSGGNNPSSSTVGSSSPSSANDSSSQNSSSNNTVNSGGNTDQNSNQSSESDTSKEANTPKYEYITATIENTYPTGYGTIHAPENAIVITKVTGTAANSNYVIPYTIDGKKVAAIMPLAFSEVSASVKSVRLPSTVRTIWNDAFKGCYSLTDIYVKSAAIGIYTDAFPEVSKRAGTLTIHCSRECMDFDYYYYRNIAYKYDAVYKEWNG